MSSGKGLLGDAPVGIDPKILTKLKITGPVTNAVFIYNLDKDKVTNENLKEVFDLAGKVVSAEVYTKDGKSIGCGSVVFERNVEAVQAISMFHRQVFHGKTMGVKIDVKHKEKHKTASKLPSGLSSIGPGLGPCGLSLKDFSPSSSDSGNSRFTHPGSRVQEPSAAYGYGDNGLRGYGDESFHGCGDERLHGYGDDSFHGYGDERLQGYGGDSSLFNCMGDGPFQYSQVPHHNSGRGMGNRNLNRKNFDQVPGHQSRNPGLGSGQSGGVGRSYTSLSEMMSDLDLGSHNGNNSTSQKQSGHEGGRDHHGNREQTSIICKNLPDYTVKDELRQRFEHIGAIRYAAIMRDKSGRSRGCGIIRFSSKQEALEAVSTMNGFKLSSRMIEVKLL